MRTRLAAAIARTAGLCRAAPRTGRHRGIGNAVVALLAFALLQCAAPPALAQFVQQGPKLFGSDAADNAEQGSSVALSADGNTAIVGGTSDNGQVGAAWVFTRSGGVWTQQGPKLVGTGAAGNAEQGFSVALSADGNTAIVGGILDNSGAGAAWVFTRANGVWTQQGPKLVGTGATGSAIQGKSVGLSADGNTAIVGGSADDSGIGATWIFTRANGVWTQQGPKLVGIDAVGNAGQGFSAALSGDGNTAIVGGVFDNSAAGATWIFTRSNGLWTQQVPKLVGTGAVNTLPFVTEQGNSVALSSDGDTAIESGAGDNSGAGATWIFTRSNGVWTQQGPKLVGTGAVNSPNRAEQGFSVALSGDGNSAIVSGSQDNSQIGAVWVFARGNGVWTQQGPKLVGTGAVNSPFGAEQGWSVALSADGNTAIVGGPGDNTAAGAVWIFFVPSAHDFNGDGVSDVLWRDSNGNVGLWLMSGATIQQASVVGDIATNWSIVGQGDFNGDGKADVLWRDGAGNVGIWLMNGTTILQPSGFGPVPTSWSVAGVGDFNGDGKCDILWVDNQNNLVMWLMNGTAILQGASVGRLPANWSIVGADRKGDIFLRNTVSGEVGIWQMNGAQVTQAPDLGVVPLNWTIAGVGDFDGNHSTDILWRDSSGNVGLWLMDGTRIVSSVVIGNVPMQWSIVQVGDYNGDGKSDILWKDAAGDVAAWFMNGTTVSSTASYGNVGANWTAQSLNAD